MRADEVALVASMCRARAGLKVAADKVYLIESRLAPVARRQKFDSISAMLAAIRERREEPLIWDAVEAMAAGETSFLRDRAPFKLIGEEILAQLSKLRGGAPIRIWSAACATGQEIYSLAMIAGTVAEVEPEVRVELAASDLSRHALERAQSGLYNQFEVQRGLPIRRLTAHFQKEGDQWRLSPEIRSRVRRKLSFGSIILLHDGGHKQMGADRSQTVVATDHLLSRYRPEGYDFITIRRMLEEVPVTATTKN